MQGWLFTPNRQNTHPVLVLHGITSNRASMKRKMCPAAKGQDGVTFIDLEFDTGAKGGALLGDIGSSLVSLDELLRDLGSIAAYPSSAEFRKIEIVAIEMRNPLKIKLSLFAIPADAVKAFQDICREIILSRERRARQAAMAASESEDVNRKRLANIRAAFDLALRAKGNDDHITDEEALRMLGHVVTLQDAEVPLTRIEVKEE